MLERDIHLDSSGNRLSGTVCLPSAEGRFATVLMIHGSGPLDRDQNMKGQRLDVFNTIAHRLASVNVASVRYDKRGCGKSTGNFDETGHLDLVDDAVHWVDTLRAQDFCDESRIILLGHSEGCIIAAEVSLKRPAVASLVLLCPFIERAEPILIKQAEKIQKELDEAPGIGGAFQRLLLKLFGQPLASQRKLVEAIKASTTPTIRIGLRTLPAKWFRELLALEPREIFAQVKCPMLLVAGEKDMQCDPADAARIAEVAQGRIERHVVANLTHILRCDAGPPSLLKTGQLLGRPVEPRVLELIARWLERQIQPRSP